MNTELTQHKQHARGMIERLTTEKLTAVAGLLEVLLDPMDRALEAAGMDDEPVTAKERRDIKNLRGIGPPEYRLRVGEWRKDAYR